MAQTPRKSSSGRKPADHPPADDLFAAADAAAADPACDAIPEEWLLEEVAPAALPAKPISLPSGVQVPGSHLPSARIEDLPATVPLPPAVVEFVPAALPVPAEPIRAASPPMVPHPPEIQDPFEIDDELPPVPVEVPNESILTETPGMSGDALSGASPEKNLTPVPPTRAGLIIPAVILLALMALFAGVLYSNRPMGEPHPSRPEPRLPISGQVATLPSIESGWRTRQPGDLVSTVEINLPQPSRQPSELLPQVKFTTDPAGTKSGFLRFIFLDPDGKIAGDVRVLKVSGGTIDPLSSGAIVSGPGTATIYGSLGFMDRPGFVAYATGSTTRWSVEISESTDYNAKEEDWTKLETFDVRNASVQ